MLKPILKKNDKKARILIWLFSVIVFVVVTISEMTKIDVELPFNPHLFAGLNGMINSLVTILLLIALYFIKIKKYEAHKKAMLIAMFLSILFLIFYLAHHLFSGRTFFGDSNADGVVSSIELIELGAWNIIYKIILYSHIILAGVVMPFILFTAYRAMIGEYSVHKKIAKWTFPIWLYVAITGVVVYLMISPYYV
jgi:putative membrane protein